MSELTRQIYHNSKEQGFCVMCGYKLPDVYDYCYCDVCRAKAREYYYRRKAGRKCIDCGKPAAPRKQRCEECFIKVKERVKQWQKQK